MCALADLVAIQHLAAIKGDIFATGPIDLPRSAIEGFFAYAPVYLPDEFQVIQDEIVVVYMIPITDSEGKFVRDVGHEAFVDLLVEQDPPLWDWSRPDLELPDL